MKRIIWHWTGGGGKANDTDKRHYHFIVERDGKIVEGNHKPEANAAPITRPNDSATYAAHTARLNTDSIGIALAGMAGATSSPFNKGSHPLTYEQESALARLTARLCKTYNIPLTRKTVLSHAEVPEELGVPQPGKWDITWLAGMPAPLSPSAVGDILRARVEEELKPKSISQRTANKFVELFLNFVKGLRK